MEDYPDFTDEQDRAELERLHGQLDWHYRADAAMHRLRARLRGEKKPASRVLPIVRRFAAVAALLLVAFGLSSRFLSPTEEQPGTIPGVYAILAPPSRAVPAPRSSDSSPDLTFQLPETAVTPEAYRRDLRSSGLPEGPPVHLTLEVRNTGTRTLTLDVGGERTQLRFDLRGPGTLTLFGKGIDPPFLKEQKVILKPGTSYFLPIPHLIGGRPSQLQGVYWTAPGRYTLSVHYRVEAEMEGRKRDLYVSTPPLTIEIQGR